MIKRVYQLADVHIPTYNKMDMYATQLTKLVEMISDDVKKSNLLPEEVRIVICGDLVNSKNIVTNELNVFGSSFIRQLSEIAKVLCIAGNHDLIESNTTRTDTLTALFETAQFPNAIFIDNILDYQSGLLQDDNITWALYSIYTGFQAPDIEEYRNTHPDDLIIGLFHGMILGSKLYNGFIADAGCDKNLFEGCNAVMAGHIHKRQVIKVGDCDVVYSGSIIQKDYGESVTCHGYAVWDIENMTHEFVDVPSDFGYYNISISSIADIEADKEILCNL